MSTVDQTLATAASDPQGERERSRRLAERYRCPFVDLFEQRIDPELFRSIPADLMFRFNFVPMEAQGNALVIAVAEPSQVLLSDELPLLLGKKLILKVATPTQIGDLLKRTEQSQRVLDQATEAFTLTVVEEDEETDATLTADSLTRESAVSPVVRLVDTVIFTALERRASDIHIEARDIEVAVKYRIDGVLVHAMAPISKDWLSTIISRIKVMSELDIAERRVPQDGVSWTSAFRSCPRFTEKTLFSAFSTRRPSRKNLQTSASRWSAFRMRICGSFAGTSANPMEWCW